MRTEKLEIIATPKMVVRDKQGKRHTFIAKAQPKGTTAYCICHNPTKH